MLYCLHMRIDCVDCVVSSEHVSYCMDCLVSSACASLLSGLCCIVYTCASIVWIV